MRCVSSIYIRLKKNAVWKTLLFDPITAARSINNKKTESIKKRKKSILI